jgi:hypothetical protein
LDNKKHKRINVCAYLVNGGICTGQLRYPAGQRFSFTCRQENPFVPLYNASRLRLEKALLYSLDGGGSFESIDIDIDNILFIKPLEHLRGPRPLKKYGRVKLAVPGYTLVGSIQHSKNGYWKENLDAFPKLLILVKAFITINGSRIRQKASYVIINKKHIIVAKEYGNSSSIQYCS